MTRPASGFTKDFSGRLFAADESFVGPGVVPSAVTAAVVNRLLIQKALNNLQRLSAFQIVDHVGIAVDYSILKQDFVRLPNEAATAQSGQHLRDIVLRSVYQRLVFV